MSLKNKRYPVTFDKVILDVDLQSVKIRDICNHTQRYNLDMLVKFSAAAFQQFFSFEE